MIEIIIQRITIVNNKYFGLNNYDYHYGLVSKINLRITLKVI